MSKAVGILEDLIKIDSSNPPGNEKLMTSYIATHFQGYPGLTILDHGENRASLVIEIPGESKESVAIIGHLDTVPVADPDKWNNDPFVPKKADDLIYGRGASDMKGGIACMISIAKYIISSNIKPHNTLKFMFTADEESGGMGIRSLVDGGFFDDVKYLLIAEPSDEAIIIKEKGALWLRIKVHGKASHGSTPELGINAIEKIYELTQKIRKLVENDEGDELLGKNSFALNKINGGTKTNVTADYCEAEIDMRTLPSVYHEVLLEDIARVISEMEEKYCGLKIDLEITNNRIPMMTEESHPFITYIKNTVISHGYDFIIKGAKFFTDGSIVLNKYDIPFAIYGPGLVNQCHMDNEYVPLDTIERAETVYRSLLTGSV